MKTLTSLLVVFCLTTPTFATGVLPYDPNLPGGGTNPIPVEPPIAIDPDWKDYLWWGELTPVSFNGSVQKYTRIVVGVREVGTTDWSFFGSVSYSGGPGGSGPAYSAFAMEGSVPEGTWEYKVWLTSPDGQYLYAE